MCWAHLIVAGVKILNDVNDLTAHLPQVIVALEICHTPHTPKNSRQAFDAEGSARQMGFGGVQKVSVTY